MAVITSDETESQATAPPVAERARPTMPSRLTLGTISPLYRWIAGVLTVLAVLVVCLVIWEPAMEFPSKVNLQQADGSYKSVESGRIVSGKVKEGTTWMVRNWGGMFNGIDLFITYTMVWLEDGLKWIPWPAAFLVIAGVAWAAAGFRLAIMAVVSLFFIGIMNRWDSAVETIAIILFAVALSITIALPLGIMGARSNRVDSIMRPILDGMQTMPSYVYLVPGILFFGLGYTPAVIATVIYAVPPAIRLTNLGIRQVSPETVEAARSFGASPLQLLTKVQMPMALPTIMAGINQTTMLALSMVVIASLVGASGLGEDVFRALQRQDPGNSVIAGMSIVLIAIVIDRITQSIARGRQESLTAGH